MIDRLAAEQGCNVVLRLDIDNNAHGEAFTAENFAGIDAAIEFTAPGTVLANVEALMRLRVPTVVGSTGWHEETGRVRQMVESNGGTLIWSSNFSVGVNVFNRLVAEAARLMAGEESYEAWAWEIHHSQKKDAPSGTLVQLVKQMERAGYARGVNQSASRAGAHPGTHEIGFDSAEDTITLRHSARGREGFARGALRAARLLPGRTGMHEFSDILFEAR